MGEDIGFILVCHYYYYYFFFFSYFVRDFPTGNVAFLLGTLNETLCERETKQATRPGDKMEAAHSTCRHQDTQ